MIEELQLKKYERKNKMNLYEWWDKTPKNEITRLAKNLRRRKFYRPDWTDDQYVWEILDSKRIGNYVILRCKRKWPDKRYWDYAVFTDLLKPRSYPCDKFAANNKESIKLFKEICGDEEREINNA